MATVYSMTTWVSNLFVESQVDRTNNEQLLNNLKEGVIIVSDDEMDASGSASILFMNAASRKITERLEDQLGIYLVRDDHVDVKSGPFFERVNRA